MSLYTCFDWCKKLRLFSNVRNLKIDVVLKASRAVDIRWFSFNEAPLGLFKFISDYLPYFEKINIFFNIIAKKVELIYQDWSKLCVWFIRNNLNQVVHTLAYVARYEGYTVCTTWLRLLLHEREKICDQSLNIFLQISVFMIEVFILQMEM